MKLKEKIAIVTGAAQGLGEAISFRLAEEGAKTVVSDVNFEKVKEVAQRINSKFNIETLPVEVDVTNEYQVQMMVEKTLNKFGRIDILVSNAGILKAYNITEFPVNVWRKIIEINLVGYFICAKEVSKVMVKQKSGVIVQINSKSGKKGSFHNSAYSASKFGGIGLTQSIALDLAPYGIRVNAVCPGNLLDSPLWIDSLYDQYSKKWGISKEQVREKYEKQVPLGRSCTYEDVCNVVVFLCSNESSYMTGQAINVTGGQEMG